MIHKWEYFFITAASFAFILSNAIYFGWVGTENPAETGIFVGHWVTSILGVLIYLKVVSNHHDH